MAEEALPIKQGDTVYFYDTSIGDIAAYSWSFSGGTPASSTNANEYVTFNGTNPSGYSVTHTVTSTSGVTDGITKSNIIQVSPETISSAFTLSASTRLMSQNNTYTSGATASSGIINYSWNIPGIGATSGANLTSISHTEDNWYDISGIYSGAVNSAYLATANLTITTNVPNTSSTNQNVTYRKMGPAEIYDLDVVGLTGPYYTPTVLGSNSGSLGIGGSSLVIKIDQSSSFSGTKFTNAKFHSTDEVLYFYPNSVDVSGGSSAPPIRLRAIFNKSQLDIAGAAYLTTNSEFISGSYILPSGITDIFDYYIYVTDYTTTAANALTSLTDPNDRGWNPEDIEEFLKNSYYKSASSKYIETLKTSTIVGRELYKDVTYSYDWSGGYTVAPESLEPGVFAPSSKFFDTYLGTSGEVEVALSFNVYNTGGEIIDSLKISLSDSGGDGNSPDGYLITAQDSSYFGLKGIASIIQIELDLTDFSDNILVESGTQFIPLQSTASKDFYGIRVSIVDPYVVNLDVNIGYIEITWFPAYLELINSIGAGTLAQPFSTSSIGTNSFSGLPQYIGNFTSPQSTKRGWSLGGEIA